MSGVALKRGSGEPGLEVTTAKFASVWLADLHPPLPTQAGESPGGPGRQTAPGRCEERPLRLRLVCRISRRRILSHRRLPRTSTGFANDQRPYGGECETRQARA